MDNKKEEFYRKEIESLDNYEEIEAKLKSFYKELSENDKKQFDKTISELFDDLVKMVYPDGPKS